MVGFSCCSARFFCSQELNFVAAQPVMHRLCETDDKFGFLPILQEFQRRMDGATPTGVFLTRTE
jgi:hypothetical protein